MQAVYAATSVTYPPESLVREVRNIPKQGGRQVQWMRLGETILKRLCGNIGCLDLNWEAALDPLHHHLLEHGAWHPRRADNHQGLWTLLQREAYRRTQNR